MALSGMRHHKCLKWYKALFYRTLEWAAVNCFILYRETLQGEQRKRFTVSQMKRLIIRDLLELSGVKNIPPTIFQLPAASHMIPVCHRRFLQEPHLIEAAPHRGICVCHLSRKTTAFICGKCLVHLCPDGCFKKFHTKADYCQDIDEEGPRGAKRRKANSDKPYECKHNLIPPWAL